MVENHNSREIKEQKRLHENPIVQVVGAYAVQGKAVI